MQAATGILEYVKIRPLVSVLSAYKKRCYSTAEVDFIEDNILTLWRTAVDAYFREDMECHGMECYFALIDYLGSVVHSVLVSYDYESVDILRKLFGSEWTVRNAPPGKLLWVCNSLANRMDRLGTVQTLCSYHGAHFGRVFFASLYFSQFAHNPGKNSFCEKQHPALHHFDVMKSLDVAVYRKCQAI